MTDKATTPPLTGAELDKYQRVREEFELAVKLGTRFDIDSAMLNVDALLAQARAQQANAAPADDHDFKNFHRLLCERFGYRIILEVQSSTKGGDAVGGEQP